MKKIALSTLSQFPFQSGASSKQQDRVRLAAARQQGGQGSRDGDEWKFFMKTFTFLNPPCKMR